jgi:hypothetical protein
VGERCIELLAQPALEHFNFCYGRKLEERFDAGHLLSPALSSIQNGGEGACRAGEAAHERPSCGYDLFDIALRLLCHEITALALSHDRTFAALAVDP